MFEAVAAAVKSFSPAGMLHKVASEGPMLRLKKGPFTSLSYYSFPIAIPVFLYILY